MDWSEKDRPPQSTNTYISYQINILMKAELMSNCVSSTLKYRKCQQIINETDL